MKALRKLNLRIDSGDFGEAGMMNQGPSWQHELSEIELKALGIQRTIGRMGQLNTLNLSTERYLYAPYTSLESKLVFEKNVAALEKVLNQSIKAARDKAAAAGSRRTASSSDTPTKCSPLYTDSKVCFTCSRLHHKL